MPSGELAKDGKITADVVYNAVAKATDSLSAMSAKMPTTVSQALQVIKNEYNYLIDDIMNQNSMMSQNIANALLWVAEHFRTLVSAAAMVGAVWLGIIAKKLCLSNIICHTDRDELSKYKKPALPTHLAYKGKSRLIMRCPLGLCYYA